MTTKLQKYDDDALCDFAANNPPGSVVQITLNKGAAALISTLRTNLLIAGFVDVKEAKGADGVTTIVTARLPSYENGTSMSLNERPVSSVWASALKSSTFEDAQAPLIDEEALLENDGIQSNSEASGCGSKVVAGQRKPCKDCSCGLADMDGNVKPSPITEPPSSGCGSCSLGDAFRCAACPYLGLPPFKPGEKVQLSSALMTSDI